MLILSSEAIEQAASPHLWTDVMELALKAVPDKDYKTPDRMHVDVSENTLLIMPSIGPDIFTTKLVSVFPENARYNQPSIHGTLLLNDGKTGEPLALLNGSKLTAMRTAAVAAVGVRHLANGNVESIGVVGAGMQGRHMAWIVGTEKEVSKIYVFDLSADMIEAFKVFVADKMPQAEVIACQSVEQLCRESQVIVTGTTSKKPVLPADKSLLEGKTIVGVGSFRPNMREFPDELFALCDKIWVDADHGKRESGDLCQPLKENIIHEEQVVSITQLLVGEEKPDRNATHVFKTVGLGIFDLFGAKLAYEKAVEGNLGQNVTL
ncbi:ornithine cyclodeaminase family protein [Marinilabiliaceae bacterium JC017]|nr:ornithine cyclodeaminase family protein [Marinilabiliaceae bacterium JC017]